MDERRICAIFRSIETVLFFVAVVGRVFFGRTVSYVFFTLLLAFGYFGKPADRIGIEGRTTFNGVTADLRGGGRIEDFEKKCYKAAPR